MIPHTNFDIFDDSAHKFWRINAWWKRCHPYTLLLLAYFKNICNEDSIIAYTHDDFQF